MNPRVGPRTGQLTGQNQNQNSLLVNAKMTIPHQGLAEED